MKLFFYRLSPFLFAVFCGANLAQANQSNLIKYCLSKGLAVHCEKKSAGSTGNNSSEILANEPGFLEVVGEYKYTGDFKNGMKHGFGTYDATSGIWYQGAFDSGIPHGAGKHIYKGMVTTGTLVHGNFNGPGRIVYPDGSQYNGNLKNNVPDGEGALYSSKGDVGLGIIFKDGQFVRYDINLKDKYPFVLDALSKNEKPSVETSRVSNGLSKADVSDKPDRENTIKLAAGERAIVLSSGPVQGVSDEREASVQRILGAPRTVYGVPGTHSMRMTYRINCASRKWSISEVVLYADQAMISTPLRRFDLSAQQVAYPPLDSDPLASELFKVTCTSPLLAISNRPGDVIGARSEVTPTSPSVDPQVPSAMPTGPSANAPKGNAPVQTSAAPERPEAESRPPQVTESLPSPPPGTDTSRAPQPPSSSAPDDSGPPVAKGRPFPDASWTLGTLAALAHYAYTDPYAQAARQQALPVLSALVERHSNGPTPSPSDIIPLGILNTAIDKAEEESRHYDTEAQTKAAFLIENGLVVDVPNGVQALLAQARNTPMLAGLRVEFYLQPSTGEHAIVFRGSAQAEDWLNNLWLGIDFGNVEAPYYQHAEKVLAAFRRERPQARIVVVGHSLGGGLAQHVGNRFDLRVVAFNSSPLPSRYIGFVSKDQQARTRVYSAVYRSPITGAVLADPVSIGVTRSAQTGLLAGLGARANQHLVRPTCTLAQPNPFSDPEEERAYLTQASLAMGTPSVFSKLGLLNQTAGRMPQAMWAERLAGDPMWATARARHGLPVQLMGQRLIEAGGRRVFAVQSGLLSAGQIGKQVLDGRVGMLAVNLSLKAAMYTARATAVSLLQAHSMERYMRGLKHIELRDSFNQFNATASEDIRNKCDALQQLF